MPPDMEWHVLLLLLNQLPHAYRRRTPSWISNGLPLHPPTRPKSLKRFGMRVTQALERVRKKEECTRGHFCFRLKRGFFCFSFFKKICILTYTYSISSLVQLSDFSPIFDTLHARGFSPGVKSGYFVGAINMVLASPFEVRVLLSTWQTQASAEWKLNPRMVAWITPNFHSRMAGERL